MKNSFAIVFLFFTLSVKCQVDVDVVPPDELTGRNEALEKLVGLNEAIANAVENAEDLTGRSDLSLNGVEDSLENLDLESELEDDLIAGMDQIPIIEEPCCGDEVKTFAAGVSVSLPNHKPLKTDDEIEAELDAEYGNDVEAKKHVLAVILKSPKLLPPPPKVDISKILAAGKKISKKVVAKKTVAKASVATVAGKVLSKLVVVPKAIAKFLLKKPLLLSAKKHALLGGALHLLGKKVMGIGAGVGLVGAKTAAAGVGLTGLSAASLSYVPGVKYLGLKAAKYIPGLGFVNTIATQGLSGALASGLSSLGGLGDYSNLFLSNVLSDPVDGQVYLVNSPYLDIVQSSQ